MCSWLILNKPHEDDWKIWMQRLHMELFDTLNFFNAADYIYLLKYD